MPNASTQSGDHPLNVIASLLARHGVEYLVIGGQAESLMGSPRITYDTDLCYRRTPENFRRLAAALRELGVTLRGAPPGLPFKPDARTLENGLNFTFDSPAGPVDFLGEVQPNGMYEKLEERAETYALWGLTLRTISLEDLIRVKQHIKRAKDSESLFQLLAIRKVRGEGPS